MPGPWFLPLVDPEYLKFLVVEVGEIGEAGVLDDNGIYQQGTVFLRIRSVVADGGVLPAVAPAIQVEDEVPGPPVLSSALANTLAELEIELGGGVGRRVMKQTKRRNLQEHVHATCMSWAHGHSKGFLPILVEALYDLQAISRI
eukprot:6470578-Amphidinium_carterae.1